MKGDNIAARLLLFGAAVLEVIGRLPSTAAAKHVADQLLRSSTGAGANYEEARGAESRRDFAHKVGVASKEMREAVYWLSLVEAAHLAPDISVDPLLAEGNELVAILMACSRTARGAPRASLTEG
jgi:four helix bundle protein